MVWLLAALALAADGPPRDARPGIALGEPVIDDIVVVSSAHTTEVELRIRARSAGRDHEVPLRKRHEQVSTVEVVRAGPDGPRTVRMAWSRNHVQDAGPDGARSFDLPVADRAYEVELGAEPTVVSVTGAGPSSAELTIVRAASDLFRLQRDLRSMLPTRIEAGQAVPTGPMFAGIIRDAPGEVTSTGTLTLLEVRPLDGVRCAVFDLRLHLQSEGELEPGVGGRFTADLVGVVAMEVETGWTRRLQVSGPVRLAGEGQRLGHRFTMEGEGRFSSDTVLDVAPARAGADQKVRPSPR